MSDQQQKVFVNSEIGTLKRLLVHSPDSGLSKVVPSKAQDWLFEDIVHLDTIRNEYDCYTRILLYFLDPVKIKGKLNTKGLEESGRDFYIPGKDEFYSSENVIELQWLLADILLDESVKSKLVASVCAIEGCTYITQKELLLYENIQLANTFITGADKDKELLFAPIPNFIFTRDIGIIIKDYILLNKPAKKARTREALLAKYIFFNHPLFSAYKDHIIELSDSHHSFLLPKEEDEKKITLEGGDIMVISDHHLLIGISERTSSDAVAKITSILFKEEIMDKITIIKIPRKRDYMHIDTVFTQVKRNVWVMLGNFSRKAVKHEDENAVERALEIKKEEKIKILQFYRSKPDAPISFESLEELLQDISKNDLNCTEEVQFIFSGNDEFPYNVREQWTDSCNVLALKEGVVLGYDRNDKTADAFRNAGFTIIHAKDLMAQFEAGTLTPEELKDTLILMPSAELSRARGGFHCMSMPILREPITQL